MSRSRTHLGNVVRGGLIGTAEAIPGVSGGTVALVTGVYETIITSAGHLVSAGRAVFRDRARAREEFRQVRWDVLFPLLIGMAPALIVALLILGPAVEHHPVPTRSLFLGMVAAALVVPIGMIGSRWRLWEVAVAALGVVAMFLILGIPATELEPTLPVVFVAAAFAVCALVLPGISGSFLLLVFGLYVPTTQAIRDVDLAYIGVFVLGAALGLSLIVRGLQWLLEHHHRITLVVMTGMIAGALRALWPWQGDERQLLAPDSQVGLSVALCLIGAALVLTVYVIERRIQGRRPQMVDTPAAPDRAATPGR